VRHGEAWHVTIARIVPLSTIQNLCLLYPSIFYTSFIHTNIVPLSIRAVVFPSLATIAKNIPVLWNKKKLFVNVLFLTAYFSRFQCFDIPLKRTESACIAFPCLCGPWYQKVFSVEYRRNAIKSISYNFLNDYI